VSSVTRNTRISAGSPAAVAPFVGRLRALPGHVFWKDDLSLIGSDLVNVDQIVTPGQVTDAYLWPSQSPTRASWRPLIGAYQPRPFAAAGLRSTSSTAAGNGCSLPPLPVCLPQNPRFFRLAKFPL
jgi:hypothetical protein